MKHTVPHRQSVPSTCVYATVSVENASYLHKRYRHPHILLAIYQAFDELLQLGGFLRSEPSARAQALSRLESKQKQDATSQATQRHPVWWQTDVSDASSTVDHFIDTLDTVSPEHTTRQPTPLITKSDYSDKTIFTIYYRRVDFCPKWISFCRRLVYANVLTQQMEARASWPSV